MHGFQKEDLSAPLAEINMTPLVDVMLVLLVIFLVTAPMLTSSINLNLPSEASAQLSEQKNLTVSIDVNGNYFLDDKAISFTELEKQFQIAAKNNPKAQVRLRADVDVNYGKVSNVLATAQRQGLSNIGFITQAK
jgi:biopolymer transport protein ExbD